MKIVFEFNDNKPEFYGNEEQYKLYAMLHAQKLGLCLKKIFKKIEDYEKEQSPLSNSIDIIRKDFLKILDENDIELKKLK